MAVAVATQWVPQEHLHAHLGATLSSHSTGLRRPETQTSITATPPGASQTHTEHDPHHLPEFDGTSLTAPPRPILYLPPLLSKLPAGYSYQHEPSEKFEPLSTETHLPDIDPASLLLHKALHKFHPVTDEYAETPYEEAFNWSELELPEDAEREWYAVVFRSKRKEGSDGGRKYPHTVVIHECISSCLLLSVIRGRQAGS